MSKKIILLIIIFVSGFLPLSYFNANRTASPLYINDEIDNTLEAGSAPKSSALKVSSLWNFTAINKIERVVISADGNYIAAINDSGIIFLHKSSNQPLWTWDSTQSTMLDVAISYDGSYITASNDGQAYLLNKNGVELWKYPDFYSGDEHYVDISSDGTKIAVINSSGGVYLFDNSASATKQYLWNYDIGSNNRDVAISNDGNYIAVGSNDGFVYLFNRSETPPKTYEWRFDATGLVELVDIGYDYVNDLYYIVASNNQKEIYLLNSTFENPKTAVWNATLNNNAVSIDISSNGKYIVACHANSMYYFNNSFSSTAKKVMWARVFSNDYQHSVAINADGKYVVEGTGSITTLYLINNENETLWSAPQKVVSVAISGKGDYIVGRGSLSESNKIYLYYHNIQKSTIIGGGGGDDDDEEEEEAAIPLGNYYLLFACVALISLIVIMKRRVNFKG